MILGLFSNIWYIFWKCTLALRNGKGPCDSWREGFSLQLKKLPDFGYRCVMFLLEHKISNFAWLTRLDCGYYGKSFTVYLDPIKKVPGKGIQKNSWHDGLNVSTKIW